MRKKKTELLLRKRYALEVQAPNRKPTNLDEYQWLQVRTKAFKKWFGDWERSARIEKLKKSESVKITGQEYKGKYELNRNSAKAFIKDRLRAEYINNDTGEIILLAKDGAQKVTSHSMGSEAHLKSIAAIPSLIENSIFIDELTNEKGSSKYNSYRYYVTGLRIGDIDYTAKLVVGVDEYGNKFYDHSLTEIEKGKLINEVGALSTTLPSNNHFTLSDVKDIKLISILQTNSSKVVDENGEPLVVYQGTPNKDNFTKFDVSKIGSANDDGIWGRGFYFSNLKKQADQYRRGGRGGQGGGNIYPSYLSIINPFQISDFKTIKEIAEYLDIDESNFTEESKGLRIVYNQINQFTSHMIDKGHDGVISSGINEIVAFLPNLIKSAIDNTGEFSTETDDIRFRQPYFYSPTELALNAIKQEKGTPEQWKAMLLKNGAKEA